MAAIIQTQDTGFIQRLAVIADSLIALLKWLAPIADLIARLWVANVFLKSGLVKFQSFSTTIFLFENEYSVPLLSPTVAAYLATFSELTFSILLLLGLAGRFSAIALFFVNVVAVISYPDLMEAGRQQHYLWGLLLLMIIAHGPGKLSVDYFISRYINR